MLRKIVVGDRAAASGFASDRPFAVISFVGTRWNKTAPKLQHRPTYLGRIIIRADDAIPESGSVAEISGSDPYFVPMTSSQADRILRFVRRVAPAIDTLFINCVQGIGRSAAAALAISEAYGLETEKWKAPPYDPNPHIVELLRKAFSGAKVKADLIRKAPASAELTAHVMRVLTEVTRRLRTCDLDEETEALVILAEMDLSGESPFFPRRRLRDLTAELAERYDRI